MSKKAYTAADYREAASWLKLEFAQFGNATPRRDTLFGQAIASALAIAARVMEPGFIAQAITDEFSQGEQPSNFDLDEATIRAALTGGSHDQ